MFNKPGNRSVKRLISVIACIICASCATAPRNEAVIGNTALKENEGIVFFSVAAHLYHSDGEKLIKEGAPKVGYSLRYGKSSGLFGATGDIAGDTQTPETLFARRLPAGEYAISKLYASLGTLSANREIEVHFTVSPNKATYIGSLQLEFRGKKGSSGKDISGQTLALNVADDRDNATNLFKAQNPGFGYEITTNLMRIKK